MAAETRLRSPLRAARSALIGAMTSTASNSSWYVAPPRCRYRVVILARLRGSTAVTIGPPPGPGLSRISSWTSSRRNASRSDARLTR